jgi:hypothetical protein
LTKPPYELAEIIKEHKASFIKQHKPLQYHKLVLQALEHCRTSYYGGHIDQCNTCDYLHISYNSCRNRHCPKCQTTQRERWIEAREKDLLPVKYFHVVFTIPQELNSYCLKYPKEMYDNLFTASKKTIETFSYDTKHLGAKPGMISILHTWGQNMSLHPHVHMIIAAGGITEEGIWKHSKQNGDYLYPSMAMAIVFKSIFLQRFFVLTKNKNSVISKEQRQLLYKKNWVVYAKQPFLGPKQVIEYLGRYTHKVAMSNHRIKNIENRTVSFTYKDYADKSKQKLMTVTAEEFLRRFCLHILPLGFRKIRHYGFLASRNKPSFRKHQFMQGIIVIQEPKKDWKQVSKEKLNYDVEVCPCCKTGKMIRIMSFDANPPPHILQMIKQKKMQTSN